MENNTKQFKTPSYILKATRKYNQENKDTIKHKNHQRYINLTPEQKQDRRQKALQYYYKKHNKDMKQKDNKENTQPSRYSLMTPAEKEAYKAKQRANYQARKQKAKQILQ
jgi:hypothetical protein